MLILFTDTDTDMTPSLAKKYGYQLISMPYIINDKEIYPYEDFENFDSKEFYSMLRRGTMPKTAAISPAKYIEYFEPFFKEGHDILYVHFSSSMSGTFDVMNIALEELKGKYPEIKFYTIDTKGVSILSLAILKEISNLNKNGKTIDEILAWANNEVDKFAVYFYADDLNFFKRSGRVSNFSAIMGTLLGIHPIIHVNDKGIMTSIAKGKGKIGTLKKIVTYVEELQDNIKDYPVMIAHSDNEELALTLGKMLKEKFGEDLNIEYSIVNPTIGAHCGPDSIGVTFHAIHR